MEANEYILRERRIVEKLQKVFSTFGLEVLSNPALSIRNNTYRPDLVIYRSGNLFAVVEVKLSFDSGNIEKVKAKLKSFSKEVGALYAILVSEESILFIELNDGTDEWKTNDFDKGVESFNEYARLQIPQEKIDTKQIKEIYTDIVEKSKLDKDKKGKLNSLSEKITQNIEIKGNTISLTPDFEDEFFLTLLGRYESNELCRYTSLNSAFLMLKEKKNCMFGLACMNDKSECYYADSYIDNHSSFSWSSLPIQMIKEVNSYFIISCSEMNLYDKLYMWRLYGNDAKGVCYMYDVNKTDEINDFWLAHVSYAREDGTHPELDLIRDLKSIGGLSLQLSRWNVWKHFFKSYEYVEECEVRLLYKEVNPSKIEWILANSNVITPLVKIDWDDKKFPLNLKGIILGPLCTEVNTNSAQIRSLLDFQQKEGVIVGESGIGNYRG
jgi:hypothetical protein